MSSCPSEQRRRSRRSCPFRGINALHQRSSDDGLSILLAFADYVVRSGRALVYPIYKATHERQSELSSDFPATSTLFRDHVIMWSKDLQRTVDYLQTRPDIDVNRIGYLGRSWGAAMGTIMVATEPRLKLAIFLVGGFYFQHARPEVEAINFRAPCACAVVDAEWTLRLLLPGGCFPELHVQAYWRAGASKAMG